MITSKENNKTLEHEAAMTNTPSQNMAEKIVEKGQRIYEERYKEDYEKNHQGKFVAVDILSEEICMGDFAEQALQKARSTFPQGIFHLIRIGSPGAFKVSYTLGTTQTSQAGAL